MRPSASTERYERTWAANGELLDGAWVTQESFQNYNGDGLLSQYQKEGWEVVAYSYNADKLLSSQSYALHTTTYDYFPNSTLLQKKTNEDGTSMSYTYDDLIRLHTVTDDNTGAVTTTSYHYAFDISQKNYIKTIATYLPDLNGYSQLTQLESRQYMDGLGRTIQSIGVGLGSNGKDLLNSVAYDKHGRQQYIYETVESTYSDGRYVAPIGDKSTTDYYPSPLNRTHSSTPTDWFAATVSYEKNQAAVDGTIMDYATNQAYADGTLFKQVTTDPNGQTATTFTDLKGRKLLSRRIDNVAYDTYYLYDDKDRLVEVIPPGSTKGDINLNYFYRYDGEDKLIKKKVSSKEWMTYKYNDKDLLMAQQDGYLLNNNKWLVHNYDALGRATKTGFYNNITPPTVTSNPTISELLHEQTYGSILDPLIERGKIKTTNTRIVGTNNFLTSAHTYDSAGRTKTIISNNHLRPDQADLIENFYDGTGNVVKVKTIISTASNSNTIENFSYIAANGRTTSEWINFNGQQKQLCEFTYTAKDEIKTKYVGGNSNSHLQKIDYEYLPSGFLHQINNGNASESDLFGYQLNYHENPTMTDNTVPLTPLQKNGNINSIGWSQVNQPFQINAYTYDALDRLEHSFTHNGEHNTSYGYDERGNISNIIRYGLLNNGAKTLIDSLTLRYKDYNSNLLDKVSDGGLATKGYKSSHADLIYEYDDNGNLIKDPQKGITIVYNYLDLPEEVIWSADKKLRFTYSAGGALLRKEVINSSNTTTIDHIGSIEYKDGEAHIIHHSEGRIVKRKPDGSNDGLVLSGVLSQNQQYNAPTITSSNVLNGGLIDYEAGEGIKLQNGFHASRNASLHAFMGLGGTPSPIQWIYEWDVRDHLGNLRLTYSDLNGNGSIDAATEILQTADYYPYGMKKAASTASSFDNLYGYNGIEEVNDFGLEVNMATFRTLDPALGRWWSVDPDVEMYKGFSPYNSMLHNPISNADPNGDNPLLVGMAIGFLSNGIGNVANGQNFFQGGIESAFYGGFGAGISAGIGSAAQGLANPGLFQVGAHAVSGGALSVAQGGNFWHGAAAGGISSGVGSALSSAGSLAQWIGGGVSGGIGSAIAGGSFLAGARQGLITGGLNHALHDLQEVYLVDKQLKEIGLNPKGVASFSLESVDKVSRLESINRLIERGANPKGIELKKGTGKATTNKGIVTLYSKNFQSWRFLATSYGHELVHYLNVQLYWDELKSAGHIGKSNKLPYYYNELLAHSWSTDYSGLAPGAPRSFMTHSINTYPGIVKKFYNKHRIRP